MRVDARRDSRVTDSVNAKTESDDGLRREDKKTREVKWQESTRKGRRPEWGREKVGIFVRRPILRRHLSGFTESPWRNVAYRCKFLVRRRFGEFFSKDRTLNFYFRVDGNRKFRSKI